MEQFDMSFWIQMVVYAVSFGVFYGRITTQIAHLEKKVEKHNSVVERTVALEHDLDNLSRRIDGRNTMLKGD